MKAMNSTAESTQEVNLHNSPSSNRLKRSNDLRRSIQVNNAQSSTFMQRSRSSVDFNPKANGKTSFIIQPELESNRDCSVSILFLRALRLRIQIQTIF
jgi:hypothetical protein